MLRSSYTCAPNQPEERKLSRSAPLILMYEGYVPYEEKQSSTVLIQVRLLFTDEKVWVYAKDGLIPVSLQLLSHKAC